MSPDVLFALSLAGAGQASVRHTRTQQHSLRVDASYSLQAARLVRPPAPAPSLSAARRFGTSAVGVGVGSWVRAGRSFTQLPLQRWRPRPSFAFSRAPGKSQEGALAPRSAAGPAAAAQQQAAAASAQVCRWSRATKPGRSLAEVAPEVARELDAAANGGLRPEEVPFSSRRRLWWRCAAGHAWEASPGSRACTARFGPSGCPQCAKLAEGSNF